GIARAETFTLNDGRTLSGEVIPGSADETGVQIKVEEGKYERVPWGAFSQPKLKEFSQDKKNKKLAEFAEPFVEITEEDRIQKTAVDVKPVPRLERPAPHSLIGALFSSSVGAFLLLAMYGANIFAAYEIALFRAQPKILVCGVAAVLPVIGPIIFLAIPTKINKPEDEGFITESPEAGPSYSVPNPQPEEAAAAGAHSGGLHLAHHEGDAGTQLPPTQTFQRGAFTFNRRFMETKFPGMFGMVKRAADKDLVLVVKAARGTYVATRISRITTNDMHLEVHKGAASEEVLVPFSEIQELQLKHKDA
ncbi:MAG TPA: hypothetical protein VK327_18250, partial [Candidatus Paceibacterota bacterium]|nr:hypothetical protein [Candidatus Paceibacterota bacterium]